MDNVSLLLFAIGLSFDTFAVSVTTGYISPDIRFKTATKIAVVLAISQGIMPLLGWLLGFHLKEFIASCDHWIAFGLLGFIGGKMIYESLTNESEEQAQKINPFNPVLLVGIALATSIDAFVVGISFALVEVNILLAGAIIFITTYFFAMAGMLIGKKVGKWFGKKMEIIGGSILFFLGIKILLEHLSA